MIFDIKPFGFPVNHFAGQLVWDIKYFHPLPQLKPSTVYDCYFILAWLGLKMEQVFEKIEMWLDVQKSFAQLNINGDVEDGIWGQVVCLNSPVKEKAAEEIRSGNPKTAFDKGDKSNHFGYFLRWATMT